MAQKAVSMGRRMASALLPVALVARPELVKAEEVDDVAQVVFQPTNRVNRLSPKPVSDESSAAMATVLSLGQRLAKRPEIQRAVEDELSSWVLVPGGLPVPPLRVRERVERLLEASDRDSKDQESKDQENKQAEEAAEDNAGLDLLSPEASPLAEYLVHSLSQPGSEPASEQPDDEQNQEEEKDHEPGARPQQELAAPAEQQDEHEVAPARDAPDAEASVPAPQPAPTPLGFWSRLGSSIRTLLFGSAAHSNAPAQCAPEVAQSPRVQENTAAGVAQDRLHEQHVDEASEQQQRQEQKEKPRARSHQRDADLRIKQIALGVAGALVMLVLVRRVNPTLFKGLVALARRTLGL